MPSSREPSGAPRTSPPSRRAGSILLDEVTAVERWQTAVKALWDGGDIRGDVVVCTGSSAIDLQRGAAERLPGRREAGSDHLVLPQSFAAFAHALDETIPASPRLSVADLCTPDGAALLRDARVHAPALERTLQALPALRRTARRRG